MINTFLDDTEFNNYNINNKTVTEESRYKF